MRAWWIMLLAISGFRRRPLRVLLTVLGVTIAASALFSMVGFALGLQQQAEAPFEKLDLLKNIEIWAKSSDRKDDDPDAPIVDTDDGNAQEEGEEDALVLDDELLAEIRSFPT
jgi:hypothetical protein